MNINYPFQIARHGQVALTDDQTYLDQLIEQTLFTIPGERLNRPNFGCNTLSLVHGHPGPAGLMTAQYMIEIGLRRSIGEEVEILEVGVRVENETLYIRINYQQPKTKEPRSLEFSRNMTG